MKWPNVTGASLLAASLLAASPQPASAGLGAYSSPQRSRCENQASARIAMWRWFERRDFVLRCIGATGGTKSGKRGKKVSSR